MRRISLKFISAYVSEIAYFILVRLLKQQLYQKKSLLRKLSKVVPANFGGAAPTSLNLVVLAVVFQGLR